jgi:tetratricopeptide (TPR) repeat protein
LVLDDLHWADSESLLLLRFVAAEARRGRVLVIGTHREVETHQLPAVPRLLADVARLGQRLVLRGLDASAVGALVRETLGSVSPEALRAIERASEGNPFFVKELTALLARGGLEPGAPLALPEEVRELIRRRLEPLPRAARELLDVAAIIGRDVELPLLATVAAIPQADALGLLVEAVRAGLLDEVDGGGERYRFAHALIHDTVYEDLPAAQRAALHRRTAAVLEEMHPLERDAYAGELARHLFRSEERAQIERAIDHAIRAGELAQAALGYEEAAGHLERALEAQISTGRPLAERIPLLLRFGEAQIGASDVDGFRATFLEAARLARELGDATLLARAALGFATLRDYGGADAAKIGLLEEAADALGEEHALLRALVLGRLASATYYAYPGRERDRLSRVAVTLARRAGDDDVLARVLLERFHALAGPDHERERLAASLETIRLAEASGARGIACEAQVQAHVDLIILGDLAGADRVLAAARSAAGELRSGYHRWRCEISRAMRALMAGELEEAEGLASSALETSRGAGLADGALVHAGQIYQIRRVQGRLDELVDLTSAAVGTYRTVSIWRIALMTIQAESGAVDTARRLFDEAAARDFTDLAHDWSFLPSLAGLADVCLLLGDAARARTLHARLAPYAGLNVTSTPGFWGPASRYVGQLALLAGDVGTALVALEDALGRCTRLGFLVEQLRAQEVLARALLARDLAGDRERAREQVAAALRRAHEHGFLGLVPALESVARAVGATPARASAGATTTPSAPAVASLLREDAGWRLACGAESMLVKHTKGLAYLRALLAAPGTGVPAVELERRARATPAGPTRDLRGALAALREELAEAESWGDLGRSESLREQIDDLIEEVTGGGAAGGQEGDVAERARLNVSRAIHATLRKVGTGCPQLARHLRSSIRTGSLCSYEHDPSFPLSWQLDADA